VLGQHGKSADRQLRPLASAQGKLAMALRVLIVPATPETLHALGTSGRTG